MKHAIICIRNTVLHACLVTILITLPACSGKSDLTGPDPAENVLGSDDGLLSNRGCPSFAEVCDELGKAVYEACPEARLLDPGDLALCKFFAFNAAFKSFVNCFSRTERLDLYECAKLWEPSPPAPLPGPLPGGDPGRGGGNAERPVTKSGEAPRRFSEPIYIGIP